MVKLSVCIPVYNFGAFVGQTLDSVRAQSESALDAVEIFVVDGASSDDTADVVRKRAVGWSQLRYVRLPQRGGIDADLAESIRLASGEYCWLLSGDDLMREGSFPRALQWLREGHDVYLCRHSNCDLTMKFLNEHPVLRDNSVRIVELSDPVQRLAYMSQAVSSEAVFSFMSGLIVRREKWMSVPDPEEFMGCCWGHVARLFSVAQTQLRICYVGEIWVERRGENDSFLEHGSVNRLRIAVDGYHHIADRFFGHDSAEAAEIRRMIRNDLSLRIWLRAKCRTHEAPALESRRELDRLVTKCYSDRDISCLMNRTAYRLISATVYRTARDAYRKIKRSRQHLIRSDAFHAVAGDSHPRE